MRYKPAAAGYLTSVDLDEVADRLYALTPGEFTAAREAEARAAKDAGEVRLARDIAALRKPTVSAWAVNQAARRHADELAELLALGEELRSAWQAQDADALADLTRRRGEVSGRLARLLRSGLSAAAAAEVEQTLEAAVVDADAADQVRQGRLARPLSYSGFAPAPIPKQRPKRKAPTKEEDEAAKAEEAARRAREREEAESAYQEWRDALALAVQEHEARAEKVAKLERKMAKARKKLAEADQRLDVTRREERHARQRLERAR
ncbi:hypothetical protein ACIBHX_43175 [Nonomuraea sp. NPDC050536]|uniref:hypothetical protein n=1 Tax=Nonomuraea sp. NPDC050536 TaxID=3364366 RepID=UPI0037C61BEB